MGGMGEGEGGREEGGWEGGWEGDGVRTDERGGRDGSEGYGGEMERRKS